MNPRPPYPRFSLVGGHSGLKFGVVLLVDWAMPIVEEEVIEEATFLQGTEGRTPVPIPVPLRGGETVPSHRRETESRPPEDEERAGARKEEHQGC